MILKTDKMFSDKFNEFVKKLKSDKKIMIVFLLAVTGTLLIVTSPSSAKTETEHKEDLSEYTSTEQLEKRLESFVEKINGAGQCEVMITFESSLEKIYAKNGKQINKQDSSESTQEYIIIDSGNSEDGLVEYTIYPKVRGVAIVCSGADDPVVKQRVVSSVSALFSLSTNKISVISMIQ